MHIQQITITFVTVCGESEGAHAIDHRGRGNLDGDVIRIWTRYANSSGISRGVLWSIRSIRTSCRGQKKEFPG